MKGSVLILFLGYCVVKVYGQIGVTPCTAATQVNCPNFLPNSYCNLGTQFCECPATYLASDTNIACEYNCGPLTDPDNGAVATKDGTRSGDNAVYTCVNTYKVVGTSTRTCVQDTGWDGAQATCEPAEIGDDCSTNPLFQCTNIANGQCQAFSTCQCIAGYEDDGTGLACSEINECNPDPCQNGATCVDQIAAYSCTCVPGYDGGDCENNIDECASDPCQSGGTCADGINEYTCTCVAGFDGDDCENNIDECTPNQCQNGATCVDGINQYTCTCVAGYDGDNCQNNIDECVGNACQNGGTCVDGINDYTCTCVAGYNGDLCENNINECLAHACQNGATCVDGINTYTCVCMAGYDSQFCSNNIDDCQGNQCQNGAICVDGVNAYTCDCADGYDGNFCLNDINECVGHVCLNGATCVDGINQYTCTCIAGYTGEFCASDIDECAANPCTNGGTCVDGINDFTCNCVAGYTDKTCSTNIDDCATSPCQNSGTCQDLINDYNCVCVAGYTDKNCQTDIDECESHACNNGATCVDLINAYECVCDAGWTDTYCTVNIDECQGNQCQNGAICVDDVNAYTCDCVDGYDGNFCQNNINECVGHVCLNGATCVDGINQYTCKCVADYTGEFCATDIDECATNPCTNGGTCVDYINDFTCNCVAGYTDKTCSTNIDDCAASPCQNSGMCQDLINDYNCVCVAGYTDKHCQTDIDECESHACNNGATCVDLINGYECVCDAGWTDTYCTVNINDCATSPCQNDGTCQDLINDYNCVCLAGYTDKNCQTDIDECESHACNNGATCVDLINGYECVCDAGWTDTYCTVNIDECQGNQCQNGAICVDGVNAYTCNCADGYNGNFCQNDINECVGHVCLNGATCVDGINQYTCKCIAGYTGKFCASDINECVGHGCLNGATCVDGINQYTCKCIAGYTGEFCASEIDECAANPCTNGGTCVDGINEFTCNCVAGFTEKTCSTNIDDCATSPCQNSGTCQDLINDYNCLCVAGYTDKNCQTNIDECKSHACNNGATCVALINAYECVCDAGWTDTYCTVNIDECSSDPCENGGSCVDEINRYTCNCVPGYNGNECENNIDECIGNVCENGATCVDAINAYTCDCVPGYDGTFCGNDIDECASHSCQNSATCIDEINTYSCVCAAGYTDFYCQTDIDECASSPCQNDGTCTDQVNGYVCTCSNGFTGLTCRPGELGDDCSARAVVCDNLTNAECDGSTCVCESGFEDPTEATGSCSRVDCGTVTPPVNGAVDHTTENTLFESKAYFSCDAGYTLTGLSSVTCQADETWDGATPSCVIKDCGTVATPLNGQLHYTPNTEYQGLAEFSCNTGFTLIGNATRTCQDNGVWSSANPFCQINDCEAIVAPTNGNVDLTDGTTYQSVAVFQCNNGYDLVGEASLECLADGSWGHAKPTCNIKDCGNLKSPTHGSVELTDGTLFEATAVFSCDAGYTLTGDSERYCTNTGVWDNSSPTCVVKANDVNICPKNTDNRGQIWIETFSGEVRKVRCKPSFSGQITRSCNSDGKWQLPVYNCVRENVQKLDSFVKSMTMNSSSEDITAALTSILTTTTADQNIASNEKLTNGEVKILITSLKNVANILPPSLVTNESIVSTFLGSVDNLLDTTNNDTWLSETDSASAGQLLSATDTLSEAISTHLKTDGAIITTIKSNIGLQASRVSRSGIHFPESEPDQNWLGKARSTIQMEWQSFPDLSKPYAATTVIYRNLNGILPNTYSEAKYNSKSTMKEEEKTIINGPVLALTLPGQKSRQLDKAISITFEHLDVGLSTPVCVHWQFRNDSNGFWSTDGCRLVLTNDDVTTCECDHLTNFAVLMSAFKKVDTSLYLSIISITGISISLLCLVLTFIVHFIFWKYLRSERTTLLMNLCISLAVAYIIFLAGIHRTESKAFCTVVAAFLHYIFLVVFCLMLVEGIQITIMVSFVFKTTKSRTRIFLIFAWVVPAVIVGISLYVTKLKGYGNNHVCWLSSDNGLIWAFVGPAVFTIFMNIICLGLVLRAVCSIGAMKIKSVSEKVKASVRSICVLLPLFGISWILGLLNIDDSFIFVQYIFAILNGLQGFFIFLSHCIFNKQIKKAFGQWQRKRRSKKFTQMKTNQLRPSTTSRDYRTTEPTRSGTSTIYRNTEPIVNLIDTHTDKTIEVQDEMNSELSGRFYLTKM